MKSPEWPETLRNFKLLSILCGLCVQPPLVATGHFNPFSCMLEGWVLIFWKLSELQSLKFGTEFIFGPFGTSADISINTKGGIECIAKTLLRMSSIRREGGSADRRSDQWMHIAESRSCKLLLARRDWKRLMENASASIWSARLAENVSDCVKLQVIQSSGTFRCQRCCAHAR